MELRHLRYFCAVAETLNFSRAAERMHVAQPSLSRQIRDLERELGVQLLVRTTTRVQLTDAGRHFHQSVEKLITQLAIAATSAQEIAHGRAGDFNIASDWRFPMHLVPASIRKFRQSHPKVHVNFTDLRFSNQLEGLRRGTIHLGFVPETSLGAREDLGLLHIYTAKLMAVLPANHPLAGQKQVRLRELADETWVLVEEGQNTDFKNFMLQTCRPAGFTPKFGRKTESAGGSLALVAAGEGCIILPSELVPPDYGGLCVLETDCAPGNIYAAWLEAAKSPLVPHFLEILGKEIDRITRKR